MANTASFLGEGSGILLRELDVDVFFFACLEADELLFKNRG
jgi:hypothetical protein